MSKGAKKPKISDLSRSHPTREEMQVVWDAIAKEQGAINPIVSAILGVACIEYELDKLLKKRLPRNDDKTWGTLTSDIGPLGTFFQKILCGYALRIYDETLRDQINHIRTIRNQFAHAKKLITFDNDLIIKEIRKVIQKLPPRQSKIFADELKVRKNPQEIYVGLCFWISLQISKKETQSLSSALRRLKKRVESLSRAAQPKPNPFYSILAAPQAPPQISSQLNPRGFPHEQNGDPKMPESQLLLAAQLRALSKKATPRKE